MYTLLSQFDIINYNGVPVRNIFTRITFSDLVKKTGAVFYPYVITEGERPDTIAYQYYEDSRYSWLVYMSNAMFDPYYDWPLTTTEFDNFILEKYGQKNLAMEKILFWRDNWRSDDSVKTPSGYAALTSSVKKYFSPVTGFNNSVVSYVRTPSDRVVDTNKIIQLTVANSSSFSVGDLISQNTSGVTSGTGEVKFSSNNIVLINNIQGQFSNTAGNVGSLVKNYTFTTTSVTNTNTISTPISSDELFYWEPVTAYTYETEVNESKRSIKLIDKAYVDQIERELSELV
jgi:hypothetical protein